MTDYKNYKVWQKSHSLVLEIYQVSKHFPSEEKFNLISQIDRAALSIPTNIAEGCGRQSQKEFHHFLHISSGSAFEMEYLIEVSRDLKFIDNNTSESLLSDISEIKKMFFSLIQKVKTEIKKA
ncbi:four helix bundle protein [Christiangramia fulva]|uniref:Four helix bundle protein n=1 Tax=Christiangramia fulva TaxID=2126553 RepID=A0A2R3Z3R2_9FLAO|nr:four helix bundle protein [Christiangramia fulva]AVR44901.1 four helix bundle protein [Christiangramia fulva]